MEIGLLQALLLGILAFLAGLDLFNGLTHFHRPVVLGPLVGAASWLTMKICKTSAPPWSTAFARTDHRWASPP